MRIVSRRTLRLFSEAHSRAKVSLDSWFKIAKKANWNSLAELKQTYPHADLVGRLVVFNIGGILNRREPTGFRQNRETGSCSQS